MRHPEEDRRKFRDIVALRPFLHVVEIVQPEADYFTGTQNGKCEFHLTQRTSRGRRRSPGQVTERLEIAVVPAQDFAEITRHICIRSLQIDGMIAIDHAKPYAIAGFKTDDLHELTLLDKYARPLGGRSKA